MTMAFHPSTYRYCPLCASPLSLRADVGEAGKLRLACPDGHWTHWDNPLPVLAAVVEYEGRILLARNAAWPEKKFALVTGFMERGETPEQGVARELKEETNLDTKKNKQNDNKEKKRKNKQNEAYHVQAAGEISRYSINSSDKRIS